MKVKDQAMGFRIVQQIVLWDTIKILHNLVYGVVWFGVN